MTSISTSKVQYFYPFTFNPILIYTTDVYDTGVIITAISALFAFGFTIFLSGFLIPSTRHIAIKYLRFHAHLLFFFDSLLFATLLPYTSYVARRSVQIATDVNPTLHYTTKLVTILPWFTFLFTFIAATIMYIASTQTVEPAPVASAQETKKTM